MRLADFIAVCQAALWAETSAAAKALAYLRGRGIRDDTIRHLQLGWCPEGTELPDGEDPEDHIWLYHRRVTVPVFSEFGEPVAIASRSPEAESSGWLNSSSNIGFEKSRHLYLLCEAKRAVFVANKAYVFEGYIDGIIARQEGLPNAVLPMGTALGLRQMGLLRRYGSELCLCFDTDTNQAGQVAQARAMLEAHRAAFTKLSSITLPTGVDPDVFIRGYGGIPVLLQLERPVGPTELRHCERVVDAQRQKGRAA